MAVPATGQLSMLGLAREKKYDNYNSTSSITGPISLYDLFVGGNTKGSGESYEPTNVLSPNYPRPANESEAIAGTYDPYQISEWYDYDHDIGDSCSNYTSISLYKNLSQAANCDTTRPAVTYYIDNTSWLSATKLLMDSGSGNCVTALAGYYYDPLTGSTPVRYWDGGSFTSTEGCF
jgi:hypothetical protein